MQGIVQRARTSKCICASVGCIEKSYLKYAKLVMHCCAGIGLSNDKVLQSRALSYADTQRYRIGTNYQMLPINAPKCPFHNSHENGAALAPMYACML